MISRPTTCTTARRWILQWHKVDPPDVVEMWRNEVVYEDQRLCPSVRSENANGTFRVHLR